MSSAGIGAPCSSARPFTQGSSAGRSRDDVPVEVGGARTSADGSLSGLHAARVAMAQHRSNQIGAGFDEE